MKFIPSRDFRVRPGAVWRDLKKERELVVTSNGQPIALMIPVNGDGLEETLRGIRRGRLTAAVRKIQEQSVRNGTDKLTMEQIDEIIQEARRRSPRERPK